jgi:hypothetical protein
LLLLPRAGIGKLERCIGEWLQKIFRSSEKRCLIVNLFTVQCLRNAGIELLKGVQLLLWFKIFYGFWYSCNWCIKWEIAGKRRRKMRRNSENFFFLEAKFGFQGFDFARDGSLFSSDCCWMVLHNSRFASTIESRKILRME